MDRKIKYFILFFLLIADLLIHIKYNPDLWNLFYTAFFIVFMFDQLEEAVPVRIRKILVCLMMLFCFIDGTFGLINNNWQNVFLSFGFLLFMIWLYLKHIDIYSQILFGKGIFLFNFKNNEFIHIHLWERAIYFIC